MQVYHLPISEAAEGLDIGVTVLKKYCRKFKVPRWPFRKLKSMEKLIVSVEDYYAKNNNSKAVMVGQMMMTRVMHIT